jgi:hypothetical protein
MTPNNRLQRAVRDKVLQIFKGQRPAAEPGRWASSRAGDSRG